MVATGRRLTTTREPLARAGLTPPAVVLNGRSRSTSRPTSASTASTTTPRSRRGCSKHSAPRPALDPCVYVEHTEIEIYVGERPSTHPGHLASFGPRAVTADLDEIVATEPVLGFGVIGHPLEPLITVVAGIGGHAETHLSGDSQWGGDTLTVAPPGLSKWAGVLAYCELVGLDPDRVLAIGDGPNDIELLTNATIAVVPEERVLRGARARRPSSPRPPTRAAGRPCSLPRLTQLQATFP